MGITGIEEFHRQLDERLSAPPEQRKQLDERIWARYGRDRAVLVSDMARFSRITRDHGIVHFLSMIRRMQAICAPVIAAHGGHLCKVVADNLFATFESAQHALEAATDIAVAARAEGEAYDDSEQVWLGFGIAAGRILDIDGDDMYGDAVNIASKLGEDTASGGDILIAADAAANVVAPEGYRLEARRTRVSAMELEYYALIS